MVINFAAGPAKLPEEVLIEVQKNLINYEGKGLSIMEMSHRSATYMEIHNDSINSLKDIIKIPDNYKILLMQAGGTGMFASICMNLMGRTGSADYVVTGSWSAKAAKEATQYGKVNMVVPKMDKYTTVPDYDKWNLDSNASYVYYCDNETVDGVEFNFIPKMKNNIPLVCDMSSNFLSRDIDVSKFGLIFAGAQKNIGTAGITVVIIREDLLGNAMKITPSVFDFSIAAKNNSIYNTPPTFVIYVMGRVFEWIKRQGGIDAMNNNSLKKSMLIYDTINESNNFYYCPVDIKVRSRMNIPFRIGSPQGDENLEKEFLKAADAEGMIQLKGHRSVGGIRASLYNAITFEETEKLAKFMKNFIIGNKK